jgi:hypothetical protein
MEDHMVTEKPLAYNINTVHDVAPWGRSRTYELVRDGKLPAKKLGASTFVLREDLVRFLQGLEPARHDPSSGDPLRVGRPDGRSDGVAVADVRGAVSRDE